MTYGILSKVSAFHNIILNEISTICELTTINTIRYMFLKIDVNNLSTRFSYLKGMYINIVGVTKQLERLANEKDCGELKEWIKSVTNHLYWAAASSTCGEEIVAKWVSVVNHVQNVHVHNNPQFIEYCHAPIDQESDQRKWLKPGYFFNL